VGQVAPNEIAAAAVEDYDLALSRRAWACACTCELAGEQLAAMAWHNRQCEETLAVMEGLHGEPFIPEQPRG
jgi:hypothetical protein